MRVRERGILGIRPESGSQAISRFEIILIQCLSSVILRWTGRDTCPGSDFDRTPPASLRIDR